MKTSADRNIKKSKTLIPGTDKFQIRLDRQKNFEKFNRDWSIHQLQLNRQLVTKNRKKPYTSIASAEFECGYTYPREIAKRAFEESLQHKKRVYVTVNTDCEYE